MAQTYIIDSDVSKHGNSDTYASFALAMAAVAADHTTDLVATNAGVITLLVRCSDGGVIYEREEIRFWTVDASNRFSIIGQKVNGQPAIMSEPTDTIGGSILKLRSKWMTVAEEEEDSFIIRANPANTTAINLIEVLEGDITCTGLVMDGSSLATSTGIKADASAITTTFSHCKIVNCNKEFGGAFRSGYFTLDHCTISDCITVRPNNQHTFTNCLIVNTPFYASTDVSPASDYNFTTQTAASSPINIQTNWGANSGYEVNTSTDIQKDIVGGWDILPDSSLVNADSTGTGNPGAYATTISADAPSVFLSIAGDTLTLLVNTKDDINADAVPHVNGSPVSAQTETKTTGVSQLTWDLTAFPGIEANSVASITVVVTDVNLAAATTNTALYGKDGIQKILILGNSLSGPSYYAEDGSGTAVHLKEMLDAAYLADGRYIYSEIELKGGGEFADYTSDSILMEKIGSGNYDLIIVQGEGRTSVLPDVSAYYEADIKTVVDAAKGAQTDVVMWGHQEQENSDESQYTTELNHFNIGATARNIDLIDVSTAWHEIRAADPTLDMFGDNTHQNFSGLYVTAMCIYRYLINAPVSSTAYRPSGLTTAHPSGQGNTSAQVDLILSHVDTEITNHFVRSTLNTCDVTITKPLSSIEQTEGISVEFTATAIDSSTGDLSAGIEWTIGTDTTVVATGPTFTSTTLPTGLYSVNAKRTGSDGKVTQASRLIRIRTLVNVAPTILQIGTRNVDHNVEFTQINLSQWVSDDNDEIDWSTLAITQPAINATATTLDGQTEGVVNVNYLGTDYEGADSLKYTVRDIQGLLSAEGTVNITVNPPPPASGVITGLQITRGTVATITMSNYTPIGDATFVEVHIGNDSNSDTYSCNVLTNTAASITFDVPSAGVISAPIAVSTITVLPIISK